MAKPERDEAGSADGAAAGAPANFIEAIVREDVAAGRNEGRVHTRFPPEPNGYLHIGHAKAICLNFTLAERLGGLCNLRFDDTNPLTEEQHYVDAITRDIRWLGFDWEDRLYFASDYFETLYDYAVALIRAGKAYVCDLPAEEISAQRGTLTTPGSDSPYRDRSVEENLDLFARMRSGEFEDGARVLRAKIDMAAKNLLLRDPVIYRILRAHHYRRGDDWCIYPTYDFTHGQSDAIEGITHSLCSLEFENHRPLYDWFIENLPVPHQPRQIEFARLKLSHTVVSKRHLIRLVDEGHVRRWDDPRMPTLAGLRRRGYTAESIRAFCERIGVAKFNSTVEFVVLENCLREDLNRRAARRMAVLDPLKVVIVNYPEGDGEVIDAVNNPEDESAGTREVRFSRELYVERDDFREEAPRKFFRLAPGREVRLRYAYYVTCDEVIKDPETGEVVELRCSYDPESRGGSTPDGRRVRGTIHWVSAPHSRPAEVRLYSPLFARANPTDLAEGETLVDAVAPDSLQIDRRARVEASLAECAAGSHFQFERLGYFCVDPDSSAELPVFNRTVALRDSWAKIEKKSKARAAGREKT